VAIACATGLEKHHHHQKKHHQRGDALLEVGHKTHHHNQHRVFKIEPCYPPPCPNYDYSTDGPTTDATTTGQGGGGITGNAGGGGGDGSQAGGNNGGSDNGGTAGGGGGGGGGGGSTDTGSSNNGGPTPLGPDPVDNSVSGPAVGVSGASGGASGAAAVGPSSSSGVNYWVQIVYPPPDPKAGLSDQEAAGCCNPTLAADRAQMLVLQKKIDAQTEVRAGHIKWMQDALDAIAKVQRQIVATNETVFELTQDITLLEQQIDQIQKKIRSDILKQNLEAAQQELANIQQNQDSIDTQKDGIQAKAGALIQKQQDIQTQLNKIPHQNIELVAAKYDPSQQS